MPEAGYRFVGWTSSFTNAMETANPISIPATRSAAWTAVFEKDETSVRKAIYIDAYGTPASDTKTWNKLGNAAFGWKQTQGPFLAADNTAAPVALRTVLPIGRTEKGSIQKNDSATANNVAFTGEAADFEAARSGNNSLFISVNHAVTNVAMIAYDVVGLKPGHPYTFRFAAARSGSNDGREALYRGIGQNRVTAYHNPMDNLDRVATVANVIPNEDGAIRLEITSGPSHVQSKRYVYLTAFSIEGDFTETPGRRILWFGNSFSNGGDIPSRVAALAEAAGKPRPVIVNASVDGKDLAYHLGQVTSNPSANVDADEIKYFSVGNWDDVVIQGYSTETTSASSTPPAEGFVPNATNLYAKVLSSAKGAGVRAVLFQTWARGVGHEFYPDTFADPDTMQGEIVANYKAAAELLKARWGTDAVTTAPVGTAFRSAKFASDFYGNDLYHAGGRYGYELVAMVLYNTIYGTYVEDEMTYAQAVASGVTALTEAEWKRVAALAHATSGFIVIMR